VRGGGLTAAAAAVAGRRWARWAECTRCSCRRRAPSMVRPPALPAIAGMVLTELVGAQLLFAALRRRGEEKQVS
jgi:hypothetical protein